MGFTCNSFVFQTITFVANRIKISLYVFLVKRKIKDNEQQSPIESLFTI